MATSPVATALPLLKHIHVWCGENVEKTKLNRVIDAFEHATESLKMIRECAPEPEPEPECLRIAFADAHPSMYEAWKARLPRTALEKLESEYDKAQCHKCGMMADTLHFCAPCIADLEDFQEPPDSEDMERHMREESQEPDPGCR